MKFFGLEIPGITRSEAMDQLDNIRVIYTPNPEILLQARTDRKYLRVLRKADLLLPDGNGLQFVSTLKRFNSKTLRFVLYGPSLLLFLFFKRPFRKEIPEIIHGSDFMSTIIDWAELRGKSVFFLGAAPGIAENTAKFFLKRNTQLKIAGHSCLNPGTDAAKLINESKAQIVFVAYGAPKQEKWIHTHLPKMKRVELIMGVGGSFDFWSGKTKRAPQWMRKLGLEWVWRLILSPRKRFKRIYNAFVKFPISCVFFDS